MISSIDHESKDEPVGSRAPQRGVDGDVDAEGTTTRAAGQDITCPGKSHKGSYRLS